MKKLLPIFLSLLFVSNVFATHYYVALTGSDSNAGTSTGSPWQTTNKVTSMMSSFVAGDTVSFNGGDNFIGYVSGSSAGTASNPIVFNSYGTGMATIDGLSAVSSWTSLGGNIWESSSTVTALSTLNMVIVNGVNIPMGRYPNSGWLTYQTYSGNTSITSSSLSGTPDYTGATVVLRKVNWVIDKGSISSQSGGTLNYTGTSSYSGQTNGMFFIQNASNLLDTINEWYFNPTTKKLDIYNTSTPTNVYVPFTANIFNLTGSGYTVISNLNLIGSNNDLITASGGSLKVYNCNISYAGNNAIYTSSSGDSLVVNNTAINQMNNDGIFQDYQGATPYVKITNSTLKNCATYAGAGANGDNAYQTIDIQSSNAYAGYNVIDSVGYNGISFNGGGTTLVEYNKITNFGMQKIDGGGIYCAKATKGDVINWNTILYATCQYSPDNADGVNGIYYDTHSNGASANYNTIAYMSGSGIHWTNADTITFTHNTIYNNGVNGNRGWGMLPYLDTIGGYFMHGVRITHNILWGVGNSSPTYSNNMMQISLQSPGDSTTWGNIDSNYYCNPISSSNLFNVQIQGAANGGGWQNLFYSFSGWQTAYHYDLHSFTAPKTTTDTSDVKFMYNYSASPVTLSLPYAYEDAAGTPYNGSITLAAYSSAVLIKMGAVTGSISHFVITNKTKNAVYN